MHKRCWRKAKNKDKEDQVPSHPIHYCSQAHLLQAERYSWTSAGITSSVSSPTRSPTHPSKSTFRFAAFIVFMVYRYTTAFQCAVAVAARIPIIHQSLCRCQCFSLNTQDMKHGCTILPLTPITSVLVDSPISAGEHSSPPC
jgi:hypothetical protein